MLIKIAFDQPRLDKDCRLLFNYQVIRHLETDKIFIPKREKTGKNPVFHLSAFIFLFFLKEYDISFL
jgi:hypothetical protein